MRDKIGLGIQIIGLIFATIYIFGGWNKIFGWIWIGCMLFSYFIKYGIDWIKKVKEKKEIK